MAAAKKYSVEQIIAKLREVEKLQGQGLSIPAAAKKLGITDQTFIGGGCGTERRRKTRRTG
jgi:transposase